VVVNTDDIPTGNCPVSDPFGTTAWDGRMDGDGPWTQIGAEHYQKYIDVTLSSEVDSETQECFYQLEIRCSYTDEIIFSEKKKECGGPDGMYGDLQVVKG
jgi:hypothetical protein